MAYLTAKHTQKLWRVCNVVKASIPKWREQKRVNRLMLTVKLCSSALQDSMTTLICDMRTSLLSRPITSQISQAMVQGSSKRQMPNLCLPLHYAIPSLLRPPVERSQRLISRPNLPMRLRLLRLREIADIQWLVGATTSLSLIFKEKIVT